MPNADISATIEHYRKGYATIEMALIKSKQAFFIYSGGVKIKECKSFKAVSEKFKALKQKAISEGWGKSIHLYNKSLGEHHPEYSVKIKLKNNELTFKYSHKDENNQPIENIKEEHYNSFDDAEKAYSDFLTEKMQQGYEEYEKAQQVSFFPLIGNANEEL